VRRTHRAAIASLALAVFACLTTIAASAQTKHWTIEVAPVYFLNLTGDASAPQPGVAVNTNRQPVTTNNVRFDYGITYAFTPKLSLWYKHEDFDFALGRINGAGFGTPKLGNNFSLLTGDIDDRIDTGGVTFVLPWDVPLSIYYQSHQRVNVAGLCLNQERCDIVNGVGTVTLNAANPASINETLYGIGVTKDFGPVSRYEGALLTAGFDAQYVARLPALSGAACTTALRPTCGSQGIAGYVGPGWQLPYSLTMRPPLGNIGVIPFVGYQRADVWWRAENTPEAFNVVDWGLVRVLRPGLTISYTNLKFNGCYCSDVVDPPDSIRFQDSIVKLTYDLNF
jgi:hypothetical protein